MAENAVPVLPVPVITAVAETTRRRRTGQFGWSFWIAVGWIVLVTGAAVLAPLLPIPDPAAVAPTQRLLPIGSPGHLLGTDGLGRDMLSRLIYGGRVSLFVAVVSAAIGLLAGATLGILAGYLKGRTEAVVVWSMDVLLSFPALILLICVVTFFGRNLVAISLALALLTVPTYTRLSRIHAKSISEREFVLASRSVGVQTPRILIRDLAPNVLPPVLSYGLVTMGLVIVVEGTLSFLGLSVSVPTASWGGLIAAGQSMMRDHPGQVLIPSLALCATVLALNIAGDVLRRRQETGAS